MQANYLGETMHIVAALVVAIGAIVAFKKMHHSVDQKVDGEVMKKWETSQQILHEYVQDIFWNDSLLGFPVRIIPQKYMITVKCNNEEIEIPINEKKICSS